MVRLPVIFCGLFVVGALLTGCAAKPQDIAFKKLGASSERQKSDSQACWAKAQSARAPKDVETAKAISTIIAAGVVGVAVLMASKAAEDADPKNVYRRNAHSKCMQKLGYKATGFVPPPEASDKPRSKTNVARRSSRPRPKKRPQCYSFSQCMQLCQDGDLPGVSSSNAYCSFTCTNRVPRC